MPRNARTRRKVQDAIYCRKCMKEKSPVNFYSATDSLLDSNGKMSVCKDCINEVFESNFASTKNLRVAVLNTCRALNIAFSEGAFNTLKAKVTNESKNIFGLYKMGLAGTANIGGADFSVMTFTEPPNQDDSYIGETDEDNSDENYQDAMEYFKYEWGDNHSYEDYEWLERKLEEWMSGYECDTIAKKELLKRIVWNEYDTKVTREKGESTDALVKEFQSLIKVASLDPKANAESSRGRDTFSERIKVIEENEPAEVFGDQRDAFVDWQNIRWYYDNFIVRSIKNFITGSRDFSIISEDNEEELDADFLDIDIEG